MDRKQFVIQAVEEKRDLIVKVSDQIFDYAEIGFHEFRTAKLYEETLKNEGFRVEMGVGGMPTAFKASFGAGKPVIGLLAEYDALPELSQKGGCAERTPADGANPDGHGCGHNLLGAGAFAAALAMKKYLEEDPEKGTVILFGCPSEEKGNGKTIMARDGVFDGVDAALTWHPMDVNKAWTVSSLANVSVFFRFKGVTAHAAASPEQGRSALDAAELMSVGVNYLREHIIPEARIHYAYRDVGGIAPNVVQGHSCVHYFVRAPKSWQVQEIYKRVIDVAEGAAKMTGTEMTYELYAGLSDYIPNRALTKLVHECMVEIGPADYSEEDFALARKFLTETSTAEELEAKKAKFRKMFGAERLEDILEHPLHTEIEPLDWNGAPMAGSTDVGDASYVMPTAQLTMATATLGTASHTWQMTAHGNTEIAHKAMLAAGEIMALSGIRLLEEPDVLKKAREEWLEETGGVYECPIPKEIKPRLDE
ncbi:MAG: amidohydrolase [Lachnospiraceae bacterium]|nr:amidohydrolase [Lachnospiraceae bacterium]